MSHMDHMERAANAAAYADRLQADLARLAGMLNHFRGASGLELLHDRATASQRALETIARRINALGRASDSGRYPLSDTEHATFDAARDLRDRMMESLSRYQRAAPRPA